MGFARCATTCFFIVVLHFHAGSCARIRAQLSEVADADRVSLAAQAGAKLLAATNVFLANHVSEETKAKERQKSLVAGLERRGLTLEKQFHLFALSHAVRFGLLETDESEKVNRVPSRYLSSSLLQRTHMQAPGPQRCPTGGNTATGIGCTEQPEVEEDYYKEYEKRYHASLRANVVNAFLNESNLRSDVINLPEVTGDIGSYLAVDEILRETAEADFAEPLSSTNPAAYLKWKRRQAARTKPWFLKAMQKLQAGLYPSNSTDKLKSLYQGLLDLADKLENIETQIKAAEDVSWDSVEIKGGIFSEAWKSTKKWFAAAASNFYEAALSIWNAFTARNEKAEGVCSTEMKTEVEGKARSQGVLPGEDIDLQDNKAHRMHLMADQVEKATRTMKDVGSTKKSDSEALDRQTQALNETYVTMTKNAKEGFIDLEQVQQAELTLKAVEKDACSEKQYSLSGMVNKVLHTLKGVLLKIKELAKHATSAAATAIHMMLPTISTRGISVYGGVIGGGLEEVVDFRNREIGYFAWGAMQAGTSALSGSFGGYMGFAVHGNKADWSLEEGYVTCIYTSYSPGINWFGLEASVGLTFALDADNSAGTFKPWVPYPQGINGVIVGWSVGAGVSLPVKWGIDHGQALYHMFTSECFDTGKRFLGGVLKKTCSSCEGKEYAMMAALRLGTWAAGFPFVSDVIFFTLWGINEILRLWEPDWEQHCSPRSTNNRNDPKHMAKTIALKIEESVATIGRIRHGGQGLVRILSEAMGKNKEGIEGSQEVQLIGELQEKACKKEPPHLELAEPRNSLPLPRRPKEKIKEAVASMSEKRLRYWCKMFNISAEDCTRKNTRLEMSEVSTDNPFGKCTSNEMCEEVTPNSECVADTAAQHLGIRRSDCRCKEGFCYSGTTALSCVSYDQPPLQDRIDKGVSVWLHQREIELGSFATQLKTLINATD